MNNGHLSDGWMWTRYWRSGRTESCADGAQLNFDALWQSYFTKFPAASKLLDLATGGGQIARAAVKAGDSLGLAFDVTGVDFADIKTENLPPAAQQLSRLTMKGKVRLEALPFAGETFDGISSQFGIEYAGVPEAAGEAARVLKKGGRGLFVLHHAKSAITTATAARLDAHKLVMGEQQPFGLAQRVFELHSRRISGFERSQAEAAFRDCVTRMQSKLSFGFEFENVSQAVGFLADLAKNPARFDPVDALRRVKHAEEEVLGWEERQRVQLGAALDQAGLGQLTQELQRHGVRAETPQELGGNARTTLAWKLAFDKR